MYRVFCFMFREGEGINSKLYARYSVTCSEKVKDCTDCQTCDLYSIPFGWLPTTTSDRSSRKLTVYVTWGGGGRLQSGVGYPGIDKIRSDARAQTLVCCQRPASSLHDTGINRASETRPQHSSIWVALKQAAGGIGRLTASSSERL